MLEESLRNLKEQFSWEPRVENRDVLKASGQVILCGMGGSRLASGFLKMLRPDLNLEIWNDYGLPSGYSRDALVIVDSYSGTTEEAIDNFRSARAEGLLAAVIASGGELLDLAKKGGMPYVILPPNVHPRIAAGYALKALLALLGDTPNKDAVGKLVEFFYADQFESAGKAIAESIKGVPVIYSSRANCHLAEHWKISFNETSKSPAFYNVMPELAHNELAGIFQGAPMDFILLRDPDDHLRIQVKMEVLESILKQKGYFPRSVNLPNTNTLLKIFTSFTMANWASVYLAKLRGINPDDMDTIEEFKKAVK